MDETFTNRKPTPPLAPACMQPTRLRLPCGGCASTNPAEVRKPNVKWLLLSLAFAACVLIGKRFL